MDGSGTAFSVANCPVGLVLKQSLSLARCASVTCAETDCCFRRFVAEDKGALKRAVRTCIMETPDGSCPIFSNDNGVMGDWNVGQVQDMDELFFYPLSQFNADISKWDTSSVSRMIRMFWSASVFNSDISKWNVSRVHLMKHMFYQAYQFNSDISKWDIARVTNIFGSKYLPPVFFVDETII